MDSIRVERAGGVATVTLDRPDRKNAMRTADWHALADLCDDLAGQREVRVVVLTGAGGDFCAGADVTASTGGLSVLDAMRVTGRAATAVHSLPQPTIAKVDGVAVGAGCNLALCCDLVVASDRARLSEIFPRRGLSVDFGGSWVLPRLVGLQRAKQLAFFGDIVDAATAARYGLVTEVVTADELDAVVDDWTSRLAAGPPVALSLTKELLDAAWSTSFDHALAAEAAAQTVNLGSEDAREAFEAFRARREPVFRGR